MAVNFPLSCGTIGSVIRERRGPCCWGEIGHSQSRKNRYNEDIDNGGVLDHLSEVLIWANEEGMI
jgi:hypothetical protein